MVEWRTGCVTPPEDRIAADLSPQPEVGSDVDSSAARAEGELERLRRRVRAEIAAVCDVLDDQAQVQDVRIPTRRELLERGGVLLHVMIRMLDWEIDAVAREQLWWMLEESGKHDGWLPPAQVRLLLQGSEPPWEATSSAPLGEVSGAAPLQPASLGRGRQDPRPKLPKWEMMQWLRRYAAKQPPKPNTSVAIRRTIRSEFSGYSIPRDFLEGGIRKIYGPRPRGRRPSRTES